MEHKDSKKKMKIFTLNIKKCHANAGIYYIFAFVMAKTGHAYIRTFGIGLIILLLSAVFPCRGVSQTSLSRKSYVPDSILTHIFHASTLYATEVKEYKADLYLKGLLQIHKQNRIITNRLMNSTIPPLPSTTAK